MIRKFVICTLVEILLHSARKCGLNRSGKYMRNGNRIVARKVGGYVEGRGVDEGITLRFILKNSHVE
jgi:hypothetical protein